MEDRQTIVDGKPLYRIKVVFVGDPGVGKSSIISRFTKEDFNLLTTRTIGIEYSIRQCETYIKGRESRIVIQCWDTVGQQKYESVSNLFYKNAIGVIFVYDITKRETFQNLEKWYKQVMERSSEFAVFMALGNKNDLKYLRTVKFDEGLNWAKQKSIIFCETSAFDNTNIQLSMLNLLQQIFCKINQQEITRNTMVIDQTQSTKQITHNSCC